MKKGILLSFVAVFAFIAFGASCSQTASNDHSTMNHNTMNHNTLNRNAMNQNTMNQNAINHNTMNHSEMTSDTNAASAPYDLQFIDTMTHHHEGAIEMSEMVLKKSSNEELKMFAQKIIDDQNEEIARMKDWREKWFAEKPVAKNMEMAGMKDSMKMMSGDAMKKWEATSGKEFDLMFLEMMTDHHKGAVTMAKDALTKAEHAEIKTLAGEIIKAQEAEIKKMSDWKTNWSK